MIRGTVASREQARTTMNTIASQGLQKARKLGNLSHEAYFGLTPPGAPESLELLGVDVWTNLEGMNEYYSDPDFTHAFDGFYTSEPSTLVLKHPAGEWVEW